MPEEDLHLLKEDVQSLKLAYGIKETYNKEFRQVVQDETRDIRDRTEFINVRFASLESRVWILVWIFGIFSAAIIAMVVLLSIHIYGGVG